MPRIITALFDSRGAADRALQALVSAGMARDRIAILGESHQRATEMAPLRSVPARDDALGGLALPDEDLQLYQEGLRRGCVLVTARIDTERYEDAIATLDMFEPVDLDRRAKEWRHEHQGAGGAQGVDVGGPLGAGLTAGASAGGTNTGALPGFGVMADSTHDVGSTDLRTDETGLSDQGRSTVPASGDRRAEERAGAPGVMELAGQQPSHPTPKTDHPAEREAGMAVGTPPSPFRREAGRSGRVRSYVG